MNLIELIKQIEPRSAGFDSAVLMHLDVTDYKRPVVTDKYVLAAINPGDRLRLAKLPVNDYVQNTEYLLAYNKSSKMMPFGRFAAYLHNRFCFAGRVSPSHDLNHKDGVSMLLVDMDTAETVDRLSPHSHFSIPLSAFDDLFRLPDPDRPALDDFDISLILQLLQEDGMLYHGGIFPDGGSFASNRSYYREYGEYVVFNMFDWPEANMVAEAMRRYQFADPVQALVSMHCVGQLTRLLDFTADPMVALYFACDETRLPADPDELAGVLVLTEADFKSSADLEYPWTGDCVVRCDPPAEFRNRAAAQAAVPVFFHDGNFRQRSYKRDIRCVLIPREAAGLLLRRSGRTAADVYPDIASRFAAPQPPLVSEAGIRKIQNACELKRYVGAVTTDYEMANYDRICLLDIEIRDRGDSETIKMDDYLITPRRDSKWMEFLLNQIVSAGRSLKPEIPYFMGYRGDFDWEGFDAELRALKPDLDVQPVMAAFVIDPTADLPKQPLRIGRDRLKLTAAVLDNIVRHYLRA